VDPNRRLTLSALAKQLGVGEATLRNWKRKGLELDADGLISPSELYAFCDTHRSLPVARKILDMRPWPEPGFPTAGLPTMAKIGDIDTARAVARASRAAALATFDALLRAATAAEEAARAHREIIERLRHAFVASEDAFLHVTTPSTLND